MSTQFRLSENVLMAGILLLRAAGATQVPHLSFEQLTDASEVIVSGRIAGSWAAWDPEHKYIWTHYHLTVASAIKGAPSSVLEFAEPGGALEGRSMSIAGSVTYATGDNMVIFLSRMPNGYLRTTGWAQGKYVPDSSGRLHAQGGSGSETTGPDGMTLTELRQRVTERVRATLGQGR